MYRSPVRLYVNRARTEIVPEDSTDAAWVLVGSGGEITDAEARRLGLLDPAAAGAAAGEPEVILTAATAQEVEDNEEPDEPGEPIGSEVKMVPGPPENKALPPPPPRLMRRGAE